MRLRPPPLEAVVRDVLRGTVLGLGVALLACCPAPRRAAPAAGLSGPYYTREEIQGRPCPNGHWLCTTKGCTCVQTSGTEPRR